MAAGLIQSLLRSDESAEQKWQHMRENPVRAGLVHEWSDWPYRIGFEWPNNRCRTGALRRPSLLRASDALALQSCGPTQCMLFQHGLVKAMPVVEIVQIHRVLRRRGVIRNTARPKDTLARLVVVDITAHRGVMLLDRLLV